MEDIRKLEAENIKLSKAMESHAKNIEKGETYIAEELAAGRKPTVVRNVNKKLEARYNELKHNHTQNTAEISSQQNIINEANFQIQNLSKNAKVNSPIKPNRPKTSSSKGMNNMENVNKWYNKKSVRNTAGIATMAAIPASYATAEMEKNKTQKIKEDIPSKTEFEPTPLVDLDGSPASVNGAPASGPQQTLKYEIADKKLFEDVRKDQLESFFKTKNTTDEANIKADILNYSAQDVEVVIDGVSGKTLTDIWDLKGNGKVLAFSLDSKMGKDNEPDLTKIDIKTT
jgi:hypothetical protein